MIIPYVFVDKEDYEIIPRTTEVIGVLDCEAKGSLHPVHTGKKRWKAMATYVALKGTLLHHRIENHCRRLIDLEPKELDLQPSDRLLYKRAMQDPQALEWMNSEIERGWNNFLTFMEDFKPEIVAVELSMVYVHKDQKGRIIHKKSMKGTVDLVAEIDPTLMSEKAYKILPLQQKSTILIDWKSGSAQVDTHHAQLEAYNYLIDITGEWDYLVEQGIIRHPQARLVTQTGRSYPVNMCVLLGGKKSYKAHVYNMDEGLFQKAQEIFFDPTPIVKTRYKSGYEKVFREGYHCNFCVHRDYDCPIYLVIDQEPKDIAVKLI